MTNLLLTGTSPHEAGVGGVILSDLLEVSAAVETVTFWLAPRQHSEPQSNSSKYITVPRRYETGWRPVKGIVGEMAGFLAGETVYRQHCRKLAKDVLRLTRERSFQQVVAVLESRVVVDVTRLLVDELSVPLRLIIWDDVSLIAMQANLDRWSRQRLLHHFGEVLRASRDIAVISENMHDAYRKAYQVDSFILRHGYAARRRYRPATGNQFVIGYAGSITAGDNFAVLIAALDECGWCLQGRRIVLRLLGVRYTLDSRQPQNIEFLGWRNPDEANEILSTCDLLYLPQTFSEELRFFSELSFPTKLSTYVSAGPPVLLHAPEYASLATVWRTSAAGPHVLQRDKQAVVEGLEKVIRAEDKQMREWLSAGDRIAEGTLGRTQFEEGAKRLLTIPSSVREG